MIKILTKIPDDTLSVLKDNEGFFIGEARFSKLDNRDFEIIKNIDHAELIDREHGVFKTPFGITDILHLSTGCKTALNVSQLLKDNKYNLQYVDLTECGVNAIKEIFLLDNADKFIYIIRHCDRLYELPEMEYSVNGIITTDVALEVI